ncbi:Hypothetical_protein [Hexamita inflata]|uniref:Hypothetical_protein n=1 Tax=Hexamita inflata TaxID=28002 RepID=A0AA86TAC9_9EUKA|nr:Hypothetical protein HINF_LOCUS480 [Hexamita inflata]
MPIKPLTPPQKVNPNKLRHDPYDPVKQMTSNNGPKYSFSFRQKQQKEQNLTEPAAYALPSVFKTEKKLDSSIGRVMKGKQFEASPAPGYNLCTYTVSIRDAVKKGKKIEKDEPILYPYQIGYKALFKKGGISMTSNHKVDFALKEMQKSPGPGNYPIKSFVDGNNGISIAPRIANLGGIIPDDK